LEYCYYKTIDDDQVIAVRQYWNKEEEIYQMIGNGFVQKFLDRLLITERAIGKKTIVVKDKQIHKGEEMCPLCIHRLKNVTSGCTECHMEWSATTKVDYEPLRNFLEVESDKKFDVIELMYESKKPCDLYFQLHFKEYYFENDLPKGCFVQFLNQFDVGIIENNAEKLLFVHQQNLYQIPIVKGNAKDEIFRLNRDQIEEMMDMNEKYKNELIDRNKILSTISK
jgi:hypothetical protein